MDLFFAVMNFFFSFSFANNTTNNNTRYADDANKTKERAVAQSAYFRLYCLNQYNRKQYLVLNKTLFGSHGGLGYDFGGLELLSPWVENQDVIPLFVFVSLESNSEITSHYIIAYDDKKWLYYKIRLPTPDVHIADGEVISVLNSDGSKLKVLYKKDMLLDGYFIFSGASPGEDEYDVFVEMEKFVLK